MSTQTVYFVPPSNIRNVQSSIDQLNTFLVNSSSIMSANNDINWNKFIFQGCTQAPSTYFNPHSQDDIDSYTQFQKTTDSSMEFAKRSNAGHIQFLGDLGYSDFVWNPDVAGTTYFTGTAFISRRVDYLDYNSLWSIYSSKTGTISTTSSNPFFGPEQRITFVKDSDYYNAIVPNGRTNVANASNLILGEIFNSSSAQQLRAKIGSKNFLYILDDHDWAENDTADNLTVSYLYTGVWQSALNNVFKNDYTNPQLAQIEARRLANPSVNPGYYYTVAYELEPGKYVQMIGTDNRTYRNNIIMQLRRAATGAYAGVIYDARCAGGSSQTITGSLSPLAPSFAKGQSVFGKQQLLWLRSVLQDDGVVPGYNKDGTSQNRFVPQSQIYFRVLNTQTTMTAGSAFKDRMSAEEAGVIAHIVRGGMIVDNGSQVVACTGVYGPVVKGLISMVSGNHQLNLNQATTGTFYTTTFVGGATGSVSFPYTVNEYDNSAYTSITAGTGASSYTGVFVKGTYDLNVRRFQSSEYRWNMVNQPTTIAIDFDLRINGGEKATVDIISFGNMSIASYDGRDQRLSYLRGNIFDSQPSQLFSETLYYSALQQGGTLN